jgi:heterodisulfide reductase subunit C
MAEKISGDGSRDLARELEALGGLDVEQCYQCGKCTAGCPVAEEMDLAPNLVVRLCQTGQRERALRSKTIWVCAACQTCMTRCPQEFDIARLMDTLRQVSHREGKVHPDVSGVPRFYEAFLEITKRLGRLSEVGLTAIYKLKRFPRETWNDVPMAPGMLGRRKLPLLPRRIRGAGHVGAIVARCMKESRE